MTASLLGKARLSKLRGGAFYVVASGLTFAPLANAVGLGIKRASGAPTTYADLDVFTWVDTLAGFEFGKYRLSAISGDLWLRVDASVRASGISDALEGDFLWLVLHEGTVPPLAPETVLGHVLAAGVVSG